MKNNTLRLLAAFVLCAAPIPVMATPVTIYNDTETAIFGGGNPNTGWTTSFDADLGLSVSLRAKNRTNGSTANDGAGTYSYATAPGPRGLWNYEFSINSGSSFLDAYDYYLAVDRDSSQGVSFATIDPLSYWFDNSFGTAATANGQGVEGLAIFLSGSNTIAQNSQNITFGGLTGYPGGALPLEQNATYTYNLFAVESGAGAGGARLVDTAINVVVGQGGASVPDTGGTLALTVLALGGIMMMKRRFGGQPAAASA